MLSIVVPTIGYASLKRSLETFRRYSPQDTKIIVIDQATEPVLNQKDINELTDVYVHVYRALGFAKAMNMGIELSDTRYVCCANDDVELIHPGWWNGVRYWFDSDPKVMGVNPASVKGYSNESDNLPCDCPGQRDPVNGNCPVCRSYKEEYTDDDYWYLMSPHTLKSCPTPNINPTMRLDGCMTWFTVFDREKFDQIKNNGCWFDEHFYPGGGEDYDLMCRIYDAGYRLNGVFNSWAYHHWSSTVKKNPPKVIESLRWNRLEGKEGSKWGSNWDGYGRKDKSIPIPPCTKVKL